MIEREAFAAWLRGKGSSIVGWVGYNTHCPLATYIEELTGEQAAVGVTEYVTESGKWEPLPEWVAPFVQHVDDYPFDSPILGTAALAILESIK